MDDHDDGACGGCGGSGCQSEDRFDRYGEHYTVEIRCTECDGSGVAADEDRLERAEDGAIEGGEVATEAPC
jgi:hypothetical protein